MERLKERYYNDYYFTTVSSDEVVEIYADSMGQKKDRVLPIGVSRTDVFFRREYIGSCQKEIRSVYGIEEDKIIILYAPTFRGNVQQARAPKLLDIEKMYEGLTDKYVILYKGHPAVKEMPDVPAKYTHSSGVDSDSGEPCKLFFINACDQKIETLMCASDMCITDYSSLIFEYSLLNRPMFFYAYDYKDYVTERGFYYDFETFVPGGIYYNEEELIKGLLTEKDETVKLLGKFRERFMSGCDGNSTLRIINRMLEGA